MVTYEAHVEVTIQMPQKCSHQSQIEHMLWVHFKCVLYVITIKSLGSFNQSSQCSQHVITGSRPPCPQCLQSCQSTIAGLEETVLKLATSVTVLEKSVCRCRDRLLSPGPHYALGEEEMVEEMEEGEENEEEEEEDGLEYATDTPSGGSYMTPPSTGGRSSPLLAPSWSSTPGDSDPENNAALRMEELEARIEAFLEEAEEDLLMDNLPPAENTSPLPVPAPIFPGIIPFTVSTGQRCVPPKNLVRKVYHPYKNPVGRCHCEPGGWCDNLPCSGRKRRVSRKVRGRGSSNGGSWSGGSCCGTSEEPVDHQEYSHDGRTPTCAPSSGSPEL